jgi:rubrerythrin
MSDSDALPSASEPIPEAPETPEAKRSQRPITALKSALTTPPAGEVKTLCERCGAEMYRMHAVWRCPACGFKTDCCGW